ncbi:flagellar hook protein FlgE [Mangrovibacter phragmitis]|uniref:Flagellar hook protein FlgE n=1 Tax=Mangrovibacter phragmitis TaxID=1691903 RepID=A0A1B7KXX7_9ENTR|nr:flagellar hook protein FlgE [Mangrovibacter phragmitis]OAT75002.1 flagellar hook protein FlgE [Mangrovibacter phragmitis]
MSFSQAVSGLNAASSNLDVIGNNIANSATYGFKSSGIAFADMFAGASSKVGLGVKVAAVIQNFSDGTVTNTSRGLDVAINQNGFFRMTDSAGSVYYSRNGQLQLDENRNLVNSQGYFVTGYPATGTPPTINQGANPVTLSIPSSPMPAKTTTTAAMEVQLNSSDDAITSTFDSTDSTTYNKKGTITVYDTQGNTHDMNVYFVKTADNTWSVYTQDSSVSGSSSSLLGTMTFDSNGNLTSTTDSTGTATATAGIFPSLTTDTSSGATPATFSLDFTGSMQQNYGSNNIVSTSQDGYAPGEMVSYAINDDGTISGTYSNGESQLLGQIALANFANPEGLQSEGDNLWSATSSSGAALLGIAGTGTFGTLTSGALESSNVDLSKELVNMIVAQRNYQSNAQTIKTQDQILNTLVNLR